MAPKYSPNHSTNAQNNPQTTPRRFLEGVGGELVGCLCFGGVSGPVGFNKVEYHEKVCFLFFCYRVVYTWRAHTPHVHKTLFVPRCARATSRCVRTRRAIWFGDICGPKPYDFIGSRATIISHTPVTRTTSFVQLRRVGYPKRVCVRFPRESLPRTRLS